VRAAIFVIEDQINVAEMTAALLRSWGHEVTIETSGKRALTILRGPTEFDVTFLDVLMPDKTGGEIYVDLKKEGSARLKRLVFLTGMGLLADEWLATTGLPVIEKGRPDMPEILAKTVQQFAELSCSRGPIEKGKGKTTPMPSTRDLRNLLSHDAEDEDDDADDTGVFIEKLEKHRQAAPYRGNVGTGGSGGGSDDDMTYAVVEYLHKKVGKVTKRVAAIEKKIDRAGWTIAAACTTGTFIVTVLYKLFETYVLKK
jgi:CheY-like chemotaxis protein